MPDQKTLLKYQLNSNLIEINAFKPSSFTILVTAKGTVPQKPKAVSRAERLKARLDAERGIEPEQVKSESVQVTSIKITVKVGKNERDNLCMNAPKSNPNPSGYDAEGNFHAKLDGWLLSPASTKRSDPPGTYTAEASTDAAQKFNAMSAMALTWDNVQVDTGYGDAVIMIDETDGKGDVRSTQLRLKKVEKFQFPEIKVTTLPGDNDDKPGHSDNGHLVWKGDRVRLSWQGQPGVPYYLIWSGAPHPIPVHASDHFDTPALSDNQNENFRLEAEVGNHLESDNCRVAVYFPEPRIVYFCADKAWTKPGDEVVLSWQFENLGDPKMEATPEPQRALNASPKGGTLKVYPTTSTTYTLSFPGTSFRAAVGVRVSQKIKLGIDAYPYSLKGPPMGSGGHGVCMTTAEGLVRINAEKVTRTKIKTLNPHNGFPRNQRFLFLVDHTGTAIVCDTEVFDKNGRTGVTFIKVSKDGETSGGGYEHAVPAAIGSNGDLIVGVGARGQGHSLARVSDWGTRANVEWGYRQKKCAVVGENGTYYGVDDNGIFDWPKGEGAHVNHWGDMPKPYVNSRTPPRVPYTSRQMNVAPGDTTHWPVYTVESSDFGDVLCLSDRDSPDQFTIMARQEIQAFGVTDDECVVVLTLRGEIEIVKIKRNKADPAQMPEAEYREVVSRQNSSVGGNNIAEMVVTGGSIYLSHKGTPDVVTYFGPVFAPSFYGEIPGSEILDFSVKPEGVTDAGTGIRFDWKLKNEGDVYFDGVLVEPETDTRFANPGDTTQITFSVESRKGSKYSARVKYINLFRRKKPRDVMATPYLTWVQRGQTLLAVATVPMTSKRHQGYTYLLDAGADDKSSSVLPIHPVFVDEDVPIQLGVKVKDKDVTTTMNGTPITYGVGKAALHFDAAGTAYVFNPDLDEIYIIEQGSKWIQRTIKLTGFKDTLVSPDGRIGALVWKERFAGAPMLSPFLVEINASAPHDRTETAIRASPFDHSKLAIDEQGNFSVVRFKPFTDEDIFEQKMSKTLTMGDPSDSYILAIGQGTPSRQSQPEDRRRAAGQNPESADDVFRLSNVGGNALAMKSLQGSWLIGCRGLGSPGFIIADKRPITDFCIGEDNRIWVVSSDGYVGRTT